MFSVRKKLLDKIPKRLTGVLILTYRWFHKPTFKNMLDYVIIVYFDLWFNIDILLEKFFLIFIYLSALGL